MSVMDNQKYCLKWDGFHQKMTNLLDELRLGEELFDVTLACSGARIGAHRILLSACSPYFRDVIRNNPCQHMVIFIREATASDLHALIEFIYRGSVHVAQCRLASFIRTAEMLQIRGLSGNDDRATRRSSFHHHYQQSKRSRAANDEAQSAEDITEIGGAVAGSMNQHHHLASREDGGAAHSMTSPLSYLSPSQQHAPQQTTGEDSSPMMESNMTSSSSAAGGADDDGSSHHLHRHHQVGAVDVYNNQDHHHHHHHHHRHPHDDEMVKVEKLDLSVGGSGGGTASGAGNASASDVELSCLEATLGQVTRYENSGVGGADGGGGYTGSGAHVADASALLAINHVVHSQHQQHSPLTSHHSSTGYSGGDSIGPGSSHSVGVGGEDGSQTTQSVYPCDACNKSYRSHQALKNHQKQHMGLTTCPLCGKVSSIVPTLRMHLKKTHNLSDAAVYAMVPCNTPRTITSHHHQLHQQQQEQHRLEQLGAPPPAHSH